MNFQEAMALLGHTPDPNEDDSAQPGYKFVLDDKYEVVMVKHPAAEQLILYANICPLSRLKLEDYKKLLIHGFLGINPKGAAFGIDEQQDSLLLWKHISSDFIGVAEILEAVNSFASKVIFYFDHFADEQELDDGQDAEAAKAEAAATPQVSEDEMFTALQTLAEEEEEEASELEEQPDPQTTVSTQEVLSNLEMLDGGSAPHSSEEVLSKLDSIGGGATSH
nr:type III secretion system chaperone [Succinivibrio sp.]